MKRFNPTIFDTKATIGEGVYTISDLAHILNQPPEKVRRWIITFFDDRFANQFVKKYSWKIDGSRAVNFQTMIELLSMFNLSKQGVSTREIIKSHSFLQEKFKTAFPFADKQVMSKLKLNGKKLIAEIENSFVNTDGSYQLNFSFISFLLEKIDFEENLAVRYYPLGKDKSIVIDPKRRFGNPVIASKNIEAEIICSHYKAGDPISYLAAIYNLTETEIEDALVFCHAA